MKVDLKGWKSIKDNPPTKLDGWNYMGTTQLLTGFAGQFGWVVFISTIHDRGVQAPANYAEPTHYFPLSDAPVGLKFEPRYKNEK